MTTLDLGNSIYTHETKKNSGLTEYRKQRVEYKSSFFRHETLRGRKAKGLDQFA